MRVLVIGALSVMVGLPAMAMEAKLGGSPASMQHQHAIAVDEDYSFLRTPADVRALEAKGELVHVTSGEHFTLSNVSFPTTRPEVLSFLEIFSARYDSATGTKLVVTSLTRPAALQPRNAHKLSVHPAGMAADLRVPADATSRAWLERELLAMERDGLIDVTREKSPAHYHIAVFGEAFSAYALEITAANRARLEVARKAAVARALAYRTPDAGESGTPTPLLLASASALLIAVPATRRVRRRRERAGDAPVS